MLRQIYRTRRAITVFCGVLLEPTKNSVHVGCMELMQLVVCERSVGASADAAAANTSAGACRCYSSSSVLLLHYEMCDF